MTPKDNRTIQQQVELRLSGAEMKDTSSPPGQEGPGVVERNGEEPHYDRYANLPEMKEIRLDLRNNNTPAEAKLWSALKEKQVEGRKFRRQHSIGRYVIDFYCPAEKLASEVDGRVHDDPVRREYDAERQADLEAVGIRVIRFKNDAVLQTLEMVVESIAGHFENPR